MAGRCILMISCTLPFGVGLWIHLVGGFEIVLGDNRFGAGDVISVFARGPA